MAHGVEEETPEEAAQREANMSSAERSTSLNRSAEPKNAATSSSARSRTRSRAETEKPATKIEAVDDPSDGAEE